MKYILPAYAKTAFAVLAFLLPAAAMAEAPKPLGPNGGVYGSWTAASYAGGAICYAFTKPISSAPAISSRGKVMLTVTQRKGSRDEVSITSGYTYPKNAAVKLSVGSKSLDFYTSGANAFTASGADAVAAFKDGDSATVTGPAPKGKINVTDKFSLSGFSAAYKAISSACP